MNDRLKGIANSPNRPELPQLLLFPPLLLLLIKLAAEWGMCGSGSGLPLLEYGGDKLGIECGVEEPWECATDPTGLAEDNLILLGDSGTVLAALDCC